MKAEFSRKSIALIVFFFVLFYIAIYSINYFDTSLKNLPAIGTLFPTYNWQVDSSSISPLYALMPALGFFAVVFLIHWTKKEMQWNFMESILFPVTFIIFSIIAFYLCLTFFYAPQYRNITSQGGELYVCSYYFEQNWDSVPGETMVEKRGNALQSNPMNCLWRSCLNCGTAELEQQGKTTQTTVCQLNYLRCFGSSPFFIFLLGGIAGWISFKLQKIVEESFL